MQLGMIGVGRMEANSVRRLLRSGEVLTALFARLRSRKQHSLPEEILFSMRARFGGCNKPQQHKSAARQNAPDIVKPKATRS